MNIIPTVLKWSYSQKGDIKEETLEKYFTRELKLLHGLMTDWFVHNFLVILGTILGAVSSIVYSLVGKLKENN